MKIVNDVDVWQDIGFNVKRFAHNSVVRMLDMGGSGKMNVQEGKITTKPAPEDGFGPICTNVSAEGVG